MSALTTTILNLPVAVSLDGTEYAPIVQGLSSDAVTRRATTSLIAQLGLASALPAAFAWVIDGNGANISSRIWGTLTVPFDGTISSATMEADQTGTVSVDIWKCTFAQYDPPTTPTVANSITGGAPPTITAAKKVTANISAWTTTLTEGDILTFYVPSASSNITRLTLNIGINRVVS